jgi:hypothetical protein
MSYLPITIVRMENKSKFLNLATQILSSAAEFTFLTLFITARKFLSRINVSECFHGGCFIHRDLILPFRMIYTDASTLRYSKKRNVNSPSAFSACFACFTFSTCSALFALSAPSACSAFTTFSAGTALSTFSALFTLCSSDEISRNAPSGSSGKCLSPGKLPSISVRYSVSA